MHPGFWLIRGEKKKGKGPGRQECLTPTFLDPVPHITLRVYTKTTVKLTTTISHARTEGSNTKQNVLPALALTSKNTT